MNKGKVELITITFVLCGVFSSNNVFSGNVMSAYKMVSSLGGEESYLALIGLNQQGNSISINITVLIIFCLVLIVAFVLTNVFFRNRRIREINSEKSMMSCLIDNLPDTIYFKDLESKFILVNKSQAKMLGLKSPEEAIGKTDHEFFAHADEAFKEEQEIIKTGVPLIDRVYKHETSEGAKFFSDTKIPLTDENKVCIGTVGITRDITQFVKTEEAMHEHQAKFEALFQNAPLAIFRLDKDMKVVEYNNRFGQMFGYDSEEMKNITQYDLLADAEIGGLIIDTIKETREVSTEIMLKRANGEEFIANLMLALLDDGFKELSIEGIVEDVTQVVRAREEIIKAKDQAIEADQLKSLFLANMSHEIRTPMNAIIGFSNMLKEEGLTDEDRNSFVDVIQSNGNSLMTLIDSIVDFSKLESEQMVVSLGEFNFKPLFDSTCEYAQNLLKTEEKFNVKVIRSMPENPDIRINSDRHRLNQVLNHLVSNAVKFTDEGEIEIGYKQDADKFIVFVRDTGIGISSKNYKTIFERFAKVNENKNRLYSGTGIGLTISKGLVELMNGAISVSSEINKGSVFTIEFKTGKN